VVDLLASLDLDEGAKANAAIALLLATKLDQAREDSTGVVAMATAGLAKELRATLEAIQKAGDGSAEFVMALFQ
jgi:hypothetical protein